jgi:hypothetical protein
MKFSRTTGSTVAVFCIMELVAAAVIAEDTSGSVGPGGKNSRLMNNQTDETQRNDKSLPPDEAIQSCQGKSIGSVCQFEDEQGLLRGACDDKPGILACNPDRDQNFGQAPNEKPAVQNLNAKSSSVTADFYSCINNTKDNPECKDCCDCLAGADGKTRTECRDTCARHDFSKNSDFITVSAPSVLGPNGNYSECVEKGSPSECKSCCEDSMGLLCGDFRHCRTACNNRYGDSRNQTLNGDAKLSGPKR